MEYAVPIGLLCTLLGAVLGYATFSRNKSREDRGEGRETGIVLTELGYIKGSVESVNKKLERMEERNLEFVERLSAVEASTKQAHKRIDHLEEHTGASVASRKGEGYE